MSTRFVAGSSQVYRTTPVNLTPPFTIGFWLWIPSNGVSGETLVCVSNNTSEEGFEVYKLTGSAQIGSGYYNGTTNPGYVNVTVALSEWIYVLFRNTDPGRRFSAMLTSGSIVHSTWSSSITPPTLDVLSVGAYYSASVVSAPSTSMIAELFVANGDVQPDGAEITPALLRELAYTGPLGIPSVAPNVVEYLPMARGATMDGIYQRGGYRQWIHGGSPTPWAHPPLSGDYVRPRQNRRLLAV